MTDNVAILAGFTVEVMAYSDNGQYDLPLLVRPGTDYGDRFRAWSMDDQEFINVNGWLFTVEEAGPD